MKPAFWTDPVVSGLPEGTRLFFIGLWMQADDGGWLRWDAAQVANELYGFEGRARRERRSEAMLEQLVVAGRIERQPDCQHLYIPHLRDHQRFASQDKQVFTIQREHESRCIVAIPQVPAGARGSPHIPATERKGTERNGTEDSIGPTTRAGARARGSTSPTGLKAILGDYDEVIRSQQAKERPDA